MANNWEIYALIFCIQCDRAFHILLRLLVAVSLLILKILAFVTTYLDAYKIYKGFNDAKISYNIAAAIDLQCDVHVCSK